MKKGFLIGKSSKKSKKSGRFCEKCNKKRSVVMKLEKRLKKCSRCQEVYYCCGKCQKDDWKLRHKRVCRTPEELKKGFNLKYLIELERKDDTKEKVDFFYPSMKADYIERNIQDPDQEIIRGTEMRIKYTYPLGRPVTFNHRRSRERYFTRKDFIMSIVRDYQRIYEEEEKTSKIQPGFAPGMLNRNHTNGIYGIWGHVLGDLLISEISIKKNSVGIVIVDFGVSS